MYTVYILRCGDGTLYTGIATDIERRLAEHRAGKGAKYTRGRGPFRLLYTKRCADRSMASRLESEIKHWNRKRKLQFIAGE